LTVAHDLLGLCWEASFKHVIIGLKIVEVVIAQVAEVILTQVLEVFVSIVASN
jgi:hypothetical protein